MYIDVKYLILEPGKKSCISRHIHQHRHTCPIALPMRRNSQHRSLLAVVTATSEPPFQRLRHQRSVRRVRRPSCEPLYTRNTSHYKQETFRYEYPLH
jgi:hypothetical protein